MFLAEVRMEQKQTSSLIHGDGLHNETVYLLWVQQLTIY